MGYIKVERKKLFSGAALLIVVVCGLTAIATNALVRERTMSRIILSGVDRNFDSDRCMNIVFDTPKK